MQNCSSPTVRSAKTIIIDGRIREDDSLDVERGVFNGMACAGNRVGRRLARRSQRGQTAVLALLVMLLLAFAGALFVTIVARNMVNARHQNRIETADYYADAGIHYVDDQLTNSTLGADWRPVPTPTANLRDPDYGYINATPPFARFNMGNGRFLVRVTYVSSKAATGATVTPGSITDGLSGFLKIEAVGREGTITADDPTTFDTSKNNATLVAWKPIGITDYGLFVTNIDNRSDIAPVGVPSIYDSGTDVAAPGIVTPGVIDFTTQAAANYQPFPVVTELGAPDAYTVNADGSLTPNATAGQNALQVTPGGPTTPGKWFDLDASGNPAGQVAPGGGTFRSNTTTRFFGLNKVYLNNAAFNAFQTSKGLPTVAGSILNEQGLVAGDILVDNYKTTTTLDAQQAAVQINPFPLSATNAALTLSSYLAPSNAPGPATPQPNAVNTNTSFESRFGMIRDGSSDSDEFGYPRQVKQLAPPVIDNVNAATGLTRYRDMAINSPPRIPTWKLSGADGYGKIIYVNNKNDVQPESTVAGTGYSLPDEWLNRTQGPTGPSALRWQGGTYTPPGVEVVLGDLRQYGVNPTNTANSAYGVYLLRHDFADDGTTSVLWQDPNQAGAPGAAGMAVTYDELDASHSSFSAANVNPNNDVIIVCEGNVRVRGIVSADAGDTANYSAQDKLPRHITIVTYGTAYIEGNLLRGNADSSIAVLAHDYVCVNTTQLTAGHIVDGKPLTRTAPGVDTDGDGNDPGAASLDFGPTSGLSEEFSFGLPPGGPANPATAYQKTAPATENNRLALYIEGRPNSSTNAAQLDARIYNPRVNPLGGIPTDAMQLNTFTFGPGATTTPGTPANPTLQTFPLATQTYPEYNAATNPQLDTLIESDPLQLFLTQNPASTADPQISRVAILPMDVRIEAVLYAQTRSFFVIPGDWFNSHGDDTVDSFASTPAAAPFTARGAGIDNTGSSDSYNQWRFPMYGQPIDLKITVYGAVSEAHQADIGAQSDWMKKWGWIPQYHGSLTGASSVNTTAEPAGHQNPDWSTTNQVPAIGLSIVYDPRCGNPIGSATTYMRLDANGYPLPFAPRLPVCPGLIYSGQTPDLPSS